MSITVEVARTTTHELVDGLNYLVPQLSSSATPLTADEVERMVQSPSLRLLVARNDDGIVGTLTLVLFEIPTGKRAIIEDVVVDEGARGLGVGEELTLRAVEIAKEFGVRSVDLTSRPSRVAANALYQKLGFEKRDTNVFRLNLN